MNFKSIAIALVVAATSAAAQRAPVKLPARSQIPPGKPFVYPAVTVDSLPNGLKFAVVENHEMPLVVVETALAGSGPLGVSFLDAPDKAGEIGLMFATLREGTATRSADAINDELRDLGTDMRFTSTTSGSFVPPWFYAGRSTWKPSLAVLADVLMNPTFPEASVDRVKTQLSTAMDRMAPVSILNRVAYGRAYGVESPYNRFATSATLAHVTRDDVIAMRQEYLRPQNTMLVVAGDVTVPEARQAIASNFGSWTRGGTTVAPIIPPPPTASTPTTIYLKDSPGLAQTLVQAVQLMPGRESPDAAAIAAMASVLGDFSVSSGSRFYTAFRVERGLSYGPSVSLANAPLGEMVPLTARAVVPPALVDSAVIVMVNVLRELRQEKPATASELEFSKKNLVGRLPGSMERLDAIATAVLNSMTDRLPAGYLNDWIKRIGSLTLPEVQAAAAKYLDPEHLTIVVVGDRAKVETALRATGIPVVIVDK